MSDQNQSGDSRADELLQYAMDMQVDIVGMLNDISAIQKAGIARELVEQAEVIASHCKCPVGHIIWGQPRAFPIEHTLFVLEMIKLVANAGEEYQEKYRNLNGELALHNAEIALYALSMMAFAFHAEAIAQREDMKVRAMVLKHALGGTVDEIMNGASP
jgi:hypothetical protein